MIYETLGTLNTALSEEILVTIIVILVMVLHLRSSILISALLPLAVLMCFIAMKTFGVDANIVALSGIAIAIGTMVDMGIILCENILKHLDEADPNEDRGHVIFRASNEVASAVLTAVSTTVVSFLPVFTMVAAEGNCFVRWRSQRHSPWPRRDCGSDDYSTGGSHSDGLKKGSTRMQRPGAFTFWGLTLIRSSLIALTAAGVWLCSWSSWWVGAIVAGLGLYKLLEDTNSS